MGTGFDRPSRAGYHAAIMNATTMTAREITALNRDITPVLLPLGSLEQHGPHLPAGTKGFLAEAIAAQASRHLKEAGLTPLVAPTYPFTPCHISEGFPGIFPIGARTFSDTIYEIGQAFHREGFHWFFPVTMTISPEALKAIDVALEDLNKLDGFKAFDPMPLWTFSPNETLGEHLRALNILPEHEIHADVKETSALLYLDPSLVKTDLLPRLSPVRTSPGWEILKGNYTFQQMGATDGFLGSPAQATPELGQRYLAEAALALAEAVRYGMAGNDLPPLPVPIRMLLKLIDLDEM